MNEGLGGSPAADVLRLDGVGVRRAGRWILAEIDWHVRAGERWIVVGPNGAGKSTLLAVASTYLWPTSGSVSVLGARIGAVDARELRRRVGYVSAALGDQIDERLTASEVVLSARDAALAPWWSTYGTEDRRRAAAALDRMGCAGLEDRTFGSLSSGERQRVQIARTLMAEPELLLLDEPAAGLDLGAREALVGRLAALARKASPAGIVLVTHHLEEIPPGFGHAAVLAEGRIAAAGLIGPTLSSDVLSKAYGVPLSVTRMGERFAAIGRDDR